MKAIIKELGESYTYEHVNSIKMDNNALDNNTGHYIINYQDENGEECEEIGLMSPGFELHLCF